MCVSPRQLVSWLGPLSPPEKENVSVPWPKSQDGCHNAHHCHPRLPVPRWVLVRFDAHLSVFFFCKVKGDYGCCMQTSMVLPCVTVPPMTPWGSVLRASASCPHPRLVKALDVIQCMVSTCFLLIMGVSLGEWIWRILQRQRIKSLAFMWVSVPASIRFKRRKQHVMSYKNTEQVV